MPNASDLRRGGRVELDGEPYVVMDVHFQSPSARGAATLVKTKVRNLRTGNVFDRTFKAQDRIIEPQVELRPVQYLYRDEDGAHFMDSESYEQFSLSAEELGDIGGYLKEGHELLLRLLAHPAAAAPTAERARALSAAARLVGLRRYPCEFTQPARSLHAESLAIWRALGDRSGISSALLHLAMEECDLSNARPLVEESLPA